MSYSYPSETFREFDRNADACGPEMLERLMEAAGTAVAEYAAEYAAGPERPVVILAGKGNNGGDALVAARLLSATRQIHIYFPFPVDAFNRLAMLNFRRLPEKNIILHRDDTLPEVLELLHHQRPVIIDGILGTGFRGTLATELADLCRIVNASSLPVISIDCPSGLDCDKGSADCCIDADVTIALCGVKTGMLADEAVVHCGKIVVRHLPGDDAICARQGDCELFDAEDAALLLPRCAFDVHKFDRGSALIIGGSDAYPNAPVLSAAAALYAGAGLVQLLLPKYALPCCQIPAAVIMRTVGDAGHHDTSSLDDIKAAVPGSTVIAAGPGMDRNHDSLSVLQYLAGTGKPLILDADALNLLAAAPDLITASHSSPLLLTPHTGEAARLLAAINAENGSRKQNAVTLARRFNAVVLLKGPRTIIAAPDGRVSYNMSGCPALATAGSGDVLTGIAAALAAAGLNMFDAARLAAYLHGAAGEKLSAPTGRFGFIADDLPRTVAQIMRLY